MTANILQSLELATSEVENLRHLRKNTILLFGNQYSILEFLELLGKQNNEGNQAETKICNFYYLHGTFVVTYYLLTRFYSYLGPGQTPINFSIEEIQNHVKAGNNCFWQLTRLLESVKNDTNVKPITVENEALAGRYVKNLENSQDMNQLGKVVDQNFNLQVAQCFKDVMDKEAREKLIQDLKEIDGVNPNLLV